MGLQVGIVIRWSNKGNPKHFNEYCAADGYIEARSQFKAEKNLDQITVVTGEEMPENGKADCGA
jgi:hypothetical protein